MEAADGFVESRDDGLENSGQCHVVLDWNCKPSSCSMIRCILLELSSLPKTPSCLHTDYAFNVD